jgi:acyl-CoA synthetase (AMP-forming)/AMP-acid ligase II
VIRNVDSNVEKLDTKMPDSNIHESSSPNEREGNDFRNEGEIWVGGRLLAVKYLNGASDDASKFVKLNANCQFHNILLDYEGNTMYFRTGGLS